jgi:hypothetical protein
MDAVRPGVRVDRVPVRVWWHLVGQMLHLRVVRVVRPPRWRRLALRVDHVLRVDRAVVGLVVLAPVVLVGRVVLVVLVFVVLRFVVRGVAGAGLVTGLAGPVLRLVVLRAARMMGFGAPGVPGWRTAVGRPARVGAAGVRSARVRLGARSRRARTTRRPFAGMWSGRVGTGGMRSERLLATGVCAGRMRLSRVRACRAWSGNVGAARVRSSVGATRMWAAGVWTARTWLTRVCAGGAEVVRLFGMRGASAG